MELIFGFTFYINSKFKETLQITENFLDLCILNIVKWQNNIKISNVIGKI